MTAYKQKAHDEWLEDARKRMKTTGLFGRECLMFLIEESKRCPVTKRLLEKYLESKNDR